MVADIFRNFMSSFKKVLATPLAYWVFELYQNLRNALKTNQKRCNP